MIFNSSKATKFSVVKPTTWLLLVTVLCGHDDEELSLLSPLLLPLLVIFSGLVCEVVPLYQKVSSVPLDGAKMWGSDLHS